MKFAMPKLTALILCAALAVAFQQTLTAQGKKVLEDAAQAMGGLEALRGIQNITREGTVARHALGQGHVTAERLLMGQPAPTTLIVDFTVPRHTSVGGRGQPTQVADWKRGGYNDAQGLALRAMEASALEEIKKEWDRDIAKFLVDALSDKSRIDGTSETQLDGKPHQVVSVKLIGGVDYKVYVDKATHLVSKLEFVEDRNPYGDMAKERIFSDYRQVGNVKLPFLTVGTETISNEKLVTLQQTWSKVAVNTPLREDLFAIPVELQERARSLAHAENVLLTPTKLAAGVYFGEGLGMNNMWVEFKDFVLVAEGPNHEAQSMEVIRQIRKTVGNKPVRYLVTTHHHSDHTGGIRTYAGEGATVLTDANNEAVIREMLTLPHTLKPDLLAKSKRKPQIEAVTDRKTISDGTRTVELMHVPNPHASGYLAIYLPKEKIIFESDMFQILQGQKIPPRVTPETKAFYEAVTKAGWDVDQIAPGHGRLVKWQDLVDVMQKAQ